MRNEEVLEPDLRIVDPHHHLWTHDPPGAYRVPELWADTGSGHRIEQTVFIQCGTNQRRNGPPELHPVGETEFVVEQAAESARGPAGAARVSGIVAFADLALGASVEPVLEAHIEAGDGLIRGIRTGAAWDETGTVHTPFPEGTPHIYADATFREGFGRLAAFDLTYDAWNYHPQIPELTDLARAFPETTIVLDHLGAPLGVGPYVGRQAEVEAALRRALDPIADCPNVVLKLGGIGMERYFGMGWFEADAPPSSDTVVERWQDQINWSIERFGAQRCMFESNYPVDRQTCSYPVLWNSFQKMTADYDDAEQDALFSGTARRVYRID